MRIVLIVFKDILLQIMLSGVFTFQIPLLFSKQYNTFSENDADERHNYQFLVVITCAISILFCYGLSAPYNGLIPINLGILPLFVGILYGSKMSGLLLSLLYVVCHELIFGFSLSGILLHTGLPMYPLLFFFSSRFKHNTLMEKIGCLWIGLIPALIIIVASPILEGRPLSTSHNAEMILMMLLYVLLSIFNGALLIYFIETMYNRLYSDHSSLNNPEKSRIKQFLDMIPLGMAVIDRRGSIVLLNEPLALIYKQSNPHVLSEGLIGSDFHVTFEHVVQQDFTKQRINQALRGARSSWEVVRTGNLIYSVGAFPLVDPQTRDIEGAVAIIHDITEIEKLKSEILNIERLSMVGQMAASITHEIRNPMAVVRGFLQLMKEKSPDNLDHYYRIVMDELDRANGIISDFLSLAQNRIAEKEECHIHDIIHELSPLLWADANIRGQSIDLKFGNYVPRLHLNVKEMKQLILNLCRNAMESMDDKGILTIETRLTTDVVELCIRDTGLGIPKEKLSRLFEPFFTTKSKGTGLGLSLCMSIVQRHHGSISVQSEEGVGTTFIVSFPIVNRDKEPLR
ncbi:nitrogen regulation protein NR(II) [Paenibacillus sp. GCM10028914]